MNKVLRAAIIILILFLGISILFNFKNIFPWKNQEAQTGEASIVIDANKIINPVNKNIFGTSIAEISRGGPLKELKNPETENLLNNLKPSFVNLENAVLGFPFYPESTGEYSERITFAETLKKMNIESDPVGKNIWAKFKDDPAANKPSEVNFDDILGFLEALDSKPNIAIRIPTIFTIMSGQWSGLKLNLDPKTGADLVHYLNDPVTTELGKLREKNGHPEPYNVKYFVLGNEMWNNHAYHNLEMEQITAQHIAFAKAMREADSSIKIGINLGDDSYPHQFLNPGLLKNAEKFLDYNDKLLSSINGYYDFATYHVYTLHGTVNEGKSMANLNDNEWKFVLAQSYLKEKYQNAEKHRQIARKYNNNAGIAVDEYSGTVADLGGAIYMADYIIYLLKNNYTYATNWNSGWFQSSELMGLVKIKTESGDYTIRPAFYALKIFTNHFEGSIVESKIESSPVFDADQIASDQLRWPAEKNIPSINAIASIKDNKLSVVIVNRELRKGIKTNVSLNGFKAKNAKVYTLNGPSINSDNEDGKDNVRLNEKTMTVSEPFEITLEKHSVTLIEFTA